MTDRKLLPDSRRRLNKFSADPDDLAAFMDLVETETERLRDDMEGSIIAGNFHQAVVQKGRIDALADLVVTMRGFKSFEQGAPL